MYIIPKGHQPDSSRCPCAPLCSQGPGATTFKHIKRKPRLFAPPSEQHRWIPCLSGDPHTDGSWKVEVPSRLKDSMNCSTWPQGQAAKLLVIYLWCHLWALWAAYVVRVGHMAFLCFRMQGWFFAISKIWHLIDFGWSLTFWVWFKKLATMDPQVRFLQASMAESGKVGGVQRHTMPMSFAPGRLLLS